MARPTPSVSIRSKTRSRAWLCFVIRCETMDIAPLLDGAIVAVGRQVVNTTRLWSCRTGTTLARMAGQEPITEGHVGELLDLDLRSTRELVELINHEDTR